MNWRRLVPRADFMGRFGLPSLDRPLVTRALWCFGVAIVPHVFHLTPWALALALGVAAWRLASLRRMLRLPPPGFFAIAVPGAVVAVALTYGTVVGRDGGTALLISFFCLKMLELRNRKDFLVVTGVSYALVLAGTLFSQSPLMCVYLLFQFIFTTGCLARLHARPADHGNRTASRLATSVMLRGLPLTLALFIFFPRLDMNLRFSPFDPSSGFADSMSPGSVAGAHADRSMAFRVEFPDGSPPPHELRYWRGIVLESTDDGMAWSRATKRPDPEPGVRRIDPTEPPRPGELRQRIDLIPSFTNWVFALDPPVAWPEAALAQPGAVVAWPYKIRSRLRYDVISSPGSPLTRLSAEEKQRCLQLPDSAELTNRVKKLAESLRAQAADDRAVIDAALRYFSSEGFSYSFYPGTYRRRALDGFLFDRKRGFCEHYAGSLATLMRLCGIPARVVLGFHGGELNPYGGFLLVRKQQAHSWTEVWIEGHGWLRVDPTSVVSPVRLRDGFAALERLIGRGFGFSIAGFEFFLLAPGWLPDPVQQAIDQFRDRIDHLNRLWDDLLGYDFGTQATLLRQLGVEKPTVPSLAVILVFMTLAAIALAWWWSRLVPLTLAPEDRMLRQIEARLGKQKLVRPPHEGVATFLNRAAGVLPDQAGKLHTCSQCYQQLHYRSLSPTIRAEYLAQMRQALDQKE